MRFSILSRVTSSRALTTPQRLRPRFPVTPVPFVSRAAGQRFSSSANMNALELSQYLADAPPSVVRLEIEKHFEALTDKQKRYAHFISK